MDNGHTNCSTFLQMTDGVINFDSIGTSQKDCIAVSRYKATINQLTHCVYYLPRAKVWGYKSNGLLISWGFMQPLQSTALIRLVPGKTPETRVNISQ